jgi:hypothetical protein
VHDLRPAPRGPLEVTDPSKDCEPLPCHHLGLVGLDAQRPDCDTRIEDHNEAFLPAGPQRVQVASMTRASGQVFWTRRTQHESSLTRWPMLAAKKVVLSP